MNERLNFEAFYHHSPERVWKALTEEAALAKWLLPTNFKPQIGLRFRFEGLDRGGKTAVECLVLEVEEGKKLSFTWDDGEAGSPSLITWKLSPKDGGTLLTLEHESALEVRPHVLIEASMNWGYALEHGLPGYLGYPPVPIVYMPEEPEVETDRRAGFRQEEILCK